MENDLLLLEAAKKLDKQALVRIFDQYAAPLYHYLVRLSGDPLLADQIVGDVFARLLEQLNAGKGPSSHLRSYLYESAYHRLIDEARYSQRRAPLDVLVSQPADAHSGALAAEDKILWEAVIDAIRHDLTSDQRHVIVLRFLEDFNIRETAAILGKEISHVKVIQGRALAKLRKVLHARQTRIPASRRRLQQLSKALGS